MIDILLLLVFAAVTWSRGPIASILPLMTEIATGELAGAASSSSVMARSVWTTAERTLRSVGCPVLMVNAPPVDLLNSLLYYVARSSKAGPRISEIRAAFNLSELLPGDEQVEHLQGALEVNPNLVPARALLARRKDIGYSVSCTTRHPRPGEIQGKDYYFVSRTEFLAKRERGEFAEGQAHSPSHAAPPAPAGSRATRRRERARRRQSGISPGP